MRRDEHGTRISTTAFEAAMWHHGVQVTCHCTHQGVHDPHGLWWACKCRGWSDRFRDLAARFYCLACHIHHRQIVRPVSVGPTSEDATIILPRPPEREWKRALKRVRS